MKGENVYLQKFEPGEEIGDVASQRLQVGIGALHPHIRYFPDDETARQSFQIAVHDHQTPDRLSQVDQRHSNDSQQTANVLLFHKKKQYNFKIF